MFTKKTQDPLIMIREMILDSSISLADILRRAKVLASQLKNQEFKKWIQNELSGYCEETDLPNYRFIHVPPLGTFSGPFNSMINNYMLPTYNLPESMQQMSEGVPISCSVRELEEMAKKDNLRHAWPAEAVMLMRDKIKLSGGYVLVEVHQPIYNTSIAGILDAVRNRLLDFILEIKELAPDTTKDELAYDKLPPDKVSQIFNITIQGNHNILASGESVTQQTTQNIGEKSQDDLSKYLQNLGIDKDDITELLNVIDHDTVKEKGEFGPKVSSWLGKMISKAASGTWNTVLAAAPDLLTKAISTYYGWK